MRGASLIISRTPVRLSFFGGGTDYPDYYLREKGAVLGVTINQYTYISINRLSAFFDYKIRVGYSKAELAHEVADIQHPSVRECLKYKGIDGYLDIHIFADLPARTGLGSSSSFTVGLLHGLYALEGRMPTKQQLAEDAHVVEQQRIGENVGSQDQVHAAYGGMNLIEFDATGFKVKPVIISASKRQLLQTSLMVFYTGQTRFASEVLEEQVRNTRAMSKDAYLKRMHAMVYEAADLISNAPEQELLGRLGGLLGESWELKKQLSSQVSNGFIDDIYQKAVRAGALGGKIAGAGGGGFVFFFVPLEKQASVRKALADLLEVNFNFDSQGSSIIYMC